MGRPVKWARDLHLLRERVAGSRVETWCRQEVERLFGVGRATAQTLMKAIGEVQTVTAPTSSTALPCSPSWTP